MFFLNSKGGISIKSKLVALYDDESFATDAISSDAGLMVNQYNEVVNYLILEYQGFFHVYLNLFDGEEPFRNILSEGIATTLEEAKEIAVNNLNKMAYER